MNRSIRTPILWLFVIAVTSAGCSWEEMATPTPTGNPPHGGSGTVYSLYEPERIIYQAYWELLGRDPDEEGLRHYRRRIIDEGWDEARVRQAITNSHEFKVVRAEVIITRAYQDLLNRDPDPEGLAHYTRLWQRGYSERAIRDRIRNSREYRQLHRRR